MVGSTFTTDVDSDTGIFLTTTKVTNIDHPTSDRTSNDLTGDYDTTVYGDGSQTIDESGSRGTSYSLHSTQTSLYTNSESGNAISSDYSRNMTISESSGSERTGNGYTVDQNATTSQTATSSGTYLTGDYTTSSTVGATVTIQETTSSSSLSQTTTNSSTMSQSGNTFTGTYSAAGTASAHVTLSQTAGSSTLNESSNETGNVVTISGNSLDGTETITTTGSETYHMNQTLDAGASSFYWIQTGGTKDFTRTEQDNSKDGSSSTTEIGIDHYTLLQSATQGTTTHFIHEDFVGGTEADERYTTTEQANSQTGDYTTTTNGTNDYGYVDGVSEDGGDVVFTTYTGSGSFSTHEDGNAFLGTVNQSKTGQDRYEQLPMFTDTSDGPRTGYGMTDFSSVGPAILVARADIGQTRHRCVFAMHISSPPFACGRSKTTSPFWSGGGEETSRATDC